MRGKAIDLVNNFSRLHFLSTLSVYTFCLHFLSAHLMLAVTYPSQTRVCLGVRR